jgi:hypothetical protein
VGATPADHREGVNRIRHYLAHAALALQTDEAAARTALGEEMYGSPARCLERSRAAIDDWVNR